MSNDAATPDAGTPDVCAIYVSDADLKAPVVSFASDVLPLFSASCGLSQVCHRSVSPGATIARWGAPLVYLGCVANGNGACDDPNPGPDVYRALVGMPNGGPAAGPQAPVEILSMPFVTRGDPSKSFLMHKIDGDLCILQGCLPNNTLDLAVQDVTSNGCGVVQPFLFTPLDDTARDLVRRWIAQGAENN